jgi:hypothetical protein
VKRIIISAAILGAFVFGCCCHKQCVKNDQPEKSRIEAKKALDEMDKEKNKENNQ